jgi:S1-C subfamily serine protease
MGLPHEDGVVVVEVVRGGPADRAGLKRGEVETHVGGRTVRSSADLRNQVALTAVGEEIELKVLRGGQAKVIRARIEEVSAGAAAMTQALPELAGVAVGTRESNGQPQAVVVVRVERGSPAWNLGLREGDLIAAVNRRKVLSVQELMAALRAATRPIVLNVVRGEYLFAIVLR